MLVALDLEIAEDGGGDEGRGKAEKERGAWLGVVVEDDYG